MMNFSVPVVKAVEKVRVALDFARKKAYPAPVSLLEVVTAHWLSQAVIVAAELDLAGHLEHGPRTVSDLASRVSAHEDSLYRLMCTLAAAGVFTESSKREFALNDLARPLLRNAPDSVHGMCVMNGRAFHWGAWGQFRHSVKTGQAAIELQQGSGLFEFLSKNPEESRVFDEAMSGWASQSAQAVAAAVDFSKFQLIADIGGGSGHFLGTLLSRNPSVKGLLFDQAHVVANAGPVLEKHHLAGRCRIESGSFFETVPTGADAYILKNIIHDWSDELSIKILRAVRAAMKPAARLFIVESVLPEGNGYHVGKLIDLEMLVCTPGGRERTQREFESLFAKADLRLRKIHPAAAIESIVEVGCLAN